MVAISNARLIGLLARSGQTLRVFRSSPAGRYAPGADLESMLAITPLNQRMRSHERRYLPDTCCISQVLDAYLQSIHASIDFILILIVFLP